MSGGSIHGSAIAAKREQRDHQRSPPRSGRGSSPVRLPSAATTAKPARMFTSEITSAEPTAAVAGTPASCAITPIAPICQTLPGT
jgi:broad specificity polyphosphatase/5'/3'-nucleotidase SurE